MRTVENWMAEYGESHRERRNIAIHRACVPLILWSVVGFLSLLRLNGQFFESVAALVFYSRLGLRPFLTMALILGISLALCYAADFYVPYVWALYAAVFALAWVGQAVGHAFEGKKPSFFKDLQFLLIGPLWILRKH
jgi:uncharacterized membrane protein YGL010W